VRTVGSAVSAVPLARRPKPTTYSGARRIAGLGLRPLTGWPAHQLAIPFFLKIGRAQHHRTAGIQRALHPPSHRVHAGPLQDIRARSVVGVRDRGQARLTGFELAFISSVLRLGLNSALRRTNKAVRDGRWWPCHGVREFEPAAFQ